eukprot:XP_001609947.1 hypothetical protein [Babesia bovis T2Bo]
MQNFVARNRNDIKAYNLETKLRGLIKREPILLLLKGTPESPKCGFSSAVSLKFMYLNVYPIMLTWMYFLTTICEHVPKRYQIGPHFHSYSLTGT